MSRQPAGEGKRTHHPLYLGKIAYNLRGGFLVRPLAIAVILGAIGSVAPDMEVSFRHIAVVPGADIDSAKTVVSCVATSVMTVVSIVFAILLMSITLASNQYSPRIIVGFTMDKITQWTLGLFLGTFSYCVCALPHLTLPSPSYTVDGSLFLALVCVVWLLIFIHHISQAISANYIVDRIASETEEIIDQMMPRPYSGTGPEPVEPMGVPVISTSSGYVRHIEQARLTKLAKQSSVAVHVVRKVGHFVPEGAAIALVSKEHKMSPALAQEIEGTFDLGPTRTLQQDVEFGILQIVDIALRAISPAVNDPSTAISCVDQLSRLLIRCAGRDPTESQYFDPPGTLRLSVPTHDVRQLAHSAFDQIRLYAQGDEAVSLRLLRAMADVSQSSPDPELKHTMTDMAHKVLSGARSRLSGEELDEVERRVRAVEAISQRVE